MADVSSDVSDAKAYLLTKNKDGASVYEHLSAVLATLLSERPENAIDVLDQVSGAIKAGAYKPASDIAVRWFLPPPPRRRFFAALTRGARVLFSRRPRRRRRPP